MGGQSTKEERHNKKSDKKGDKMKDEYVKFIMREQIRREKEFKEKSRDKEGIYTKIKTNYNKDDTSFSHDDHKHS